MGITDATIHKWLKGVGDRIESGEPVAEMETAKSIVEILAPTGGVLLQILVPEGEDADLNQVIALIEESA